MSFRAPRSEVMFSHRYERQAVRQMAFNFEDIFRDYIKSPVAINNLPENAPPPVTRFQIADGKRLLAVSELQTQLSLDFGNVDLENNDLSGKLMKPAQIMDKINPLFDRSKKSFNSVTLTFFRPFEGNQREVARFISRLFAMNSDGSEVAASCTRAVDCGDHVLAFEFSQYKFFDFVANIPIGSSASIGFDADFELPSHEGLQVKVEAHTRDINPATGGANFVKLIEYVSAAMSNEIVREMLKHE